MIIIQIGTDHNEYMLYLTNAPRRYDYGYCIPVAGPDRPDPKRIATDWTLDARLVLIPKLKTSFQTARYASGLYQYQRHDDMPVSAIMEILWNRLAPECDD